MKKIMIFSFIFISLILGNRIVQAETIDIGNGLQCDEIVLQDDGIASKKCVMGFTISDGEVTYNNLKAHFAMQNLIIDSLTLEDGWYIDSNTNDTYNLQTTSSSLSTGYHKVGTIIFHKVVTTEPCRIDFDYSFSTINRSCMIYENNYYGKDGNIVDELTYQKECGNNVCTILPDGTIYGKNGNIVDELTYQKECGNNICTILPDGTIYGKNGNIVDELTYQKECGNNICTILPDGTIYGKNGQVTDQATFDKECNKKNICTIVNGKYYDSKGNETTKESYMFDCESKVENPKTGALLPIITIIGSGLLGFGILHVAKKYDRFI